MDETKKTLVGLELLDIERDRAIIRVARRLSGPDAPLVLLHAHVIRQTAVLDFVKTESPEHLTQELDRATDKLKALAAEIGGPVEIDVAIGHPPEVILERSKEMGLVVIGRTERALVQRVIEGSVESRLVASTPCPLVIVP